MASSILDKKFEYQKEMWKFFSLTQDEMESLKTEVNALAESSGRADEVDTEALNIHEMKAYYASLVGLDNLIEAREAMITAKKERGEWFVDYPNARSSLATLRSQRGDQIREKMAGMTKKEREAFSMSLSKYEKEDICNINEKID